MDMVRMIRYDNFDANGEVIEHSVLTCAIIGHLVGDYLLQTDWMALNKKRSYACLCSTFCPFCIFGRIWSLPCLVHCLLWTASVMLFAGWRSPVIAAVLFTTHYIQDRTNIIAWWMSLKWKDQSKFLAPPCGPWSAIVVDNVWHIVTIWFVWRFLVV